jgi:hypothetical protein
LAIRPIVRAGKQDRIGARAVDRTVARLNIEHYRRLLATETDAARRQTLQRLLAEEEAKLTDKPAAEKKRRRLR